MFVADENPAEIAGWMWSKWTTKPKPLSPAVQAGFLLLSVLLKHTQPLNFKNTAINTYMDKPSQVTVSYLDPLLS